MIRCMKKTSRTKNLFDTDKIERYQQILLEKD